MSKSAKRRRGFAGACSCLGTIILVLVIVASIPATVPRLFNCQVYAVISGSMEPSIQVGSLVCVEGYKPENIVEGDVIAFYSDDSSGAVIVHRVVSNRVLGGEFVTKGDANDTEDLHPVSYDRFQGKLIFAIPYMGRILYLTSTPEGKLASVSVIFLAAMLHVVAAILRKPKKKK